MPTIMVVDDTETGRETLLRLLRREGYDASAAGNGLEAVRSLGKATPDLLLLDVAEAHGLQLLELLDETPQWKSLPVVMMIGVSDTHTIRRLQQLEAKAYLVKTAFSVGQMLSTVRRCTRPALH